MQFRFSYVLIIPNSLFHLSCQAGFMENLMDSEVLLTK
jgi:hypothetical protein